MNIFNYIKKFSKTPTGPFVGLFSMIAVFLAFKAKVDDGTTLLDAFTSTVTSPFWFCVLLLAIFISMVWGGCNQLSKIEAAKQEALDEVLEYIEVNKKLVRAIKEKEKADRFLTGMRRFKKSAARNVDTLGIDSPFLQYSDGYGEEIARLSPSSFLTIECPQSVSQGNREYYQRCMKEAEIVEENCRQKCQQLALQIRELTNYGT